PERLSDDARLAHAIHSVSVRQGLPSLVLIRRMRPDWTLERYENALQDAHATRRLAHVGRATGLLTHSHPAASIEERICLRGANRGQGGTVGEEAPRTRGVVP